MLRHRGPSRPRASDSLVGDPLAWLVRLGAASICARFFSDNASVPAMVAVSPLSAEWSAAATMTPDSRSTARPGCYRPEASDRPSAWRSWPLDLVLLIHSCFESSLPLRVRSAALASSQKRRCQSAFPSPDLARPRPFNTQPKTVSWISRGSRPRVFDNHE
jgi:hypothetical protein